MRETFRLMSNKVESVHVGCACNTTPIVRDVKDVLPQVSLTAAAFTLMLEQIQSAMFNHQRDV